MDANLQISTKLIHPVEDYDSKYVSGLSTILVATIQEAKDRVSQIEDIFCSQIFPYFQLNLGKHLQKMYSEAREVAESAFKEKERDLMLRIHSLQLENQNIIEEKMKELEERKRVSESLEKTLESNSSLLHSYEKTMKELEQKNSMLKKLELEITELQAELTKKSEKLDEVMLPRNGTLRPNPSCVKEKDIQLKVCEEKTKRLLSQLEHQEKKSNELLGMLSEKTSELEKGNDLHRNLLKKVESQAAEIMNHESENKLLSLKVDSLVSKISKIDQLLPLVDCEKIDKDQLVDALDDLLNGVDKLSTKCLSVKREVDSETTSSELQADKRKKTDVIAAYKRLKSQYNYLLKKYAERRESSETYLNEAPTKNQLQITSSVSGNDDDSKRPAIANDSPKTVEGTRKCVVRNERFDHVRKNAEGTTTTTGAPPPEHHPPESSSSRGTKRPYSHWKNTRSHQSRVGPDPHDDFLDTPLENMRLKSAKAKPEEDDANNSDDDDDDDDDETQDVNAEASRKSGYKYVESIRRKSERENLKGFECKQCKKFYEAVSSGKNNGCGCEHHGGVSRHRFRYAPPSTPEGFWNIGFESEI
ncbi:hypothetical protein M569_05991 [Genlisea aurea]|uniref:DNA endonuclease activator Ctp1 C-terminal domain-containing protein n=1 Tax=Genlisea aurea TaxID=192259 RepID=S8DZJ9_9LAMI|nr:hypothetical protein M569_05991 [Genlisea aurea]